MDTPKRRTVNGLGAVWTKVQNLLFIIDNRVKRKRDKSIGAVPRWTKHGGDGHGGGGEDQRTWRHKAAAAIGKG